jgi:hypothetical protein
LPLESPPVKSETINDGPKADQGMSNKVDQSLEHSCHGQFYKAPEETLLKKPHESGWPLEKVKISEVHISNSHVSLLNNNSSTDSQIEKRQSSDGKPKVKTPNKNLFKSEPNYFTPRGE